MQRHLIKELRECQKRVEEDREEAVDTRSETLSEHFKQAKHNLLKLESMEEAIIDAQIFRKLGVYARNQADQLQTGLNNYDVKSFTDILVAHTRDGGNEGDDTNASICFRSLGKGVSGSWMTTPGLSFMHDIRNDENASVRKEREPLKKIRKTAVAVELNSVKHDEIERSETDHQLAEMKRVLKSRPSWNFWELVLDPTAETGFTRSVENIFHSSFLVKENVALLDMTKKPEEISYLGFGEEKGNATGGTYNSQVIIGFDRKIWMEKVKEHNIKKCLLPSRPRAKAKTETGTKICSPSFDEEEDKSVSS